MVIGAVDGIQKRRSFYHDVPPPTMMCLRA
jgi:hypothetical protein